MQDGGHKRHRDTRPRDDADLVSALGRRLQADGVAFDRLVLHVGTLHPEVFARLVALAPGGPVEVYGQNDPATIAGGFPGSPFREAAASGRKLVTRHAELQFLGRAAGQVLESRGLSELVCVPIERDGCTMVLSVCTARPGGFSVGGHAIQGMLASLQKGQRRLHDNAIVRPD